jgi:hypothetical protein
MNSLVTKALEMKNVRHNHGSYTHENISNPLLRTKQELNTKPNKLRRKALEQGEVSTRKEILPFGVKGIRKTVCSGRRKHFVILSLVNTVMNHRVP